MYAHAYKPLQSVLHQPIPNGCTALLQVSPGSRNDRCGCPWSGDVENPFHNLLLKGLCLGKWDSGYAEDICRAVRMDDNNMIGNLQVGSYIIGIKNSSIT